MTTSIPLRILPVRDVAFCSDNRLLGYYIIVARKIQVFFRTFFGEVCFKGRVFCGQIHMCEGRVRVFHGQENGSGYVAIASWHDSGKDE